MLTEKDRIIGERCDELRAVGLSWVEITNVLNEELGYDYPTDSSYRKSYKRYTCAVESDLVSDNLENLKDTLSDEQREYMDKVKISDEKTNIRGMLRAISREETLKDIAKEVAETLKDTRLIEPVTIYNKFEAGNSEAILILSDWHYGIDYEGFANTFNPVICKERVKKLREEVIKILTKEQVKHLHIFNLGDLISGNIHLPLRINSRVDVISQTMHVAEILAEFIEDMTKIIPVTYSSCVDNHSRVNANKKESLQIESFARFIDWHIVNKMELTENSKFIYNPNHMGDDIIDTYLCGKWKVLGVHGHLDSPTKALKDLTRYCCGADMVVSAHLHHFNANEDDGTVLYCNGSMCGTDDFAHSLRAYSPPSQLMIISTPECVDKVVYKIRL